MSWIRLQALDNLLKNTATSPIQEDNEVEYRFRIELGTGIAILKHILTLKNSEFHSIADFIIMENKESKVGRVIYSNGKLEKKEYYTKKRLFSEHGSNKNDTPVRLVISRETEIEKFRLKPSIVVKHKFRYKYIFSGWIIELSMSQMITNFIDKNQWKVNNDKILELLKSKVFEQSNTSIMTLEAEYINKDGILDYENAVKVFDHCSDLISKFSTNESLHIKNIGILARILLEDIRESNIIDKFGRERGQKDLLSKVITLGKNIYMSIIGRLSNFLVTEKTDGVRAWCKLEKVTFFISTAKQYIPIIISKIVEYERTIIDVEVVGKTVFIFDVFVNEGDKVFKKKLSERIKGMNKIAALFNKIQKEYKFVAKEYFRLPEYSDKKKLEKIFKGILNKKRDHEIDGIILSEDKNDMLNTLHYKWKPPEMSSIDLTLKKYPLKDGIKIKGKTKYIAFCGISRTRMQQLKIREMKNFDLFFPNAGTNYRPIQFSTSINPYSHIIYLDEKLDLDNKMCELVPNIDGTWTFLKVREDRIVSYTSVGNDYANATANYMNSLNPLRFEDLYTVYDSYFLNVSSEAYAGVNKTNNLTKRLTIEKYNSGNQWVIDLGSGRGADYGKFVRSGVQNYIGIDNDIGALQESQMRILSSRGQVIPTYYFNYDLSLGNFKPLLDKINNIEDFEGADGIVANLMFHYLLGGTDINNIAKFVNKLLKKGGTFSMLVMDGDVIFNILEDVKSFDLYENENIKFSIRKKYKDKKFKAQGQKISVYLPFIQDWRDEYLVNINHVKRVFENNGFSTLAVNRTSDSFDLIEKKFPKIIRLLDENDYSYLDLFATVIFKKI